MHRSNKTEETEKLSLRRHQRFENTQTVQMIQTGERISIALLGLWVNPDRRCFESQFLRDITRKTVFGNDIQATRFPETRESSDSFH